MSSRKPSSNHKGFAGNGKNSGGNGTKNWENNHARIFEPTRKKVEFNLDTLVTDKLGEYEEYLKELYRRDPNMNGVIESILLDGFSNHSDFQNWLAARDKKDVEQAGKNPDSKTKDQPTTEEMNILENIGKSGQQKAGTGAAV